MEQINLLRKLIKETIEEITLDEGSISTIYALTDDWEAKYKALKPSSQTDRVIKFITNPPIDEETKNPVAATKRGRPKVADDAKRLIGAKIISKFSKGSVDFDDEEIAFIEDLYKAVSEKK